MTLPTTNNPISIQQINYELGVANTTQRSLNDAVLRTLFGVASGAISFSNGWGKSNAPAVTPGSQTFTSSGTFTVPAFNTLTVIVQGGGGAGYHEPYSIAIEGNNPTSGINAVAYNCTDASGNLNMASRYGGTSSFGAYLSATGGQNGYRTSASAGTGGAGGYGIGGDQNYTGSIGGSARAEVNNSSPVGSEGQGGAVASYGVYASGGAAVAVYNAGSWNGAANIYGNNGNVYGGGGSSLAEYDPSGKMGWAVGPGGGGGGLSRKVWTNNTGLTAGSTVAVTVGTGSPRPYIQPASGAWSSGGAGAQGIVIISWS